MEQTRLQLDDQHATPRRGAEEGVRLAVGPRRVAEAFFRHDPPAPRELELAINAVEDEMMRARSHGAGGGELVTNDATLRLFAVAAQSMPTLAIDGVEQLFQRLA